MVSNRKGTAAEVPMILPGVMGACDNWNYRREHARPSDDLELVEFIVAEANTLVVDIYDIHPSGSSTGIRKRPGIYAITS